MPQTEAEVARSHALSWKRVLVAVLAILALAVMAAVVVPYARWFVERNTNIGPAAAFPGLRLPLVRKVVTTDSSYGPWAAWTSSNGTIEISRGARSWPADRYARLVSHEYGHALLDDAIAGGRYWSVRRVLQYERITALKRGSVPPSDMPPNVRDVFAVYEHVPDQVYASKYWRGLMATHFTDSFGEFFAESFSRWRAGDSVDPSIAAAFARLTR